MWVLECLRIVEERNPVRLKTYTFLQRNISKSRRNYDLFFKQANRSGKYSENLIDNAVEVMHLFEIVNSEVFIRLNNLFNFLSKFIDNIWFIENVEFQGLEKIRGGLRSSHQESLDLVNKIFIVCV
jgi:hypothetical protein